MKWLLVLLAVLAGGLVWAALAVPTNAAVVNGATISQQQLNSDVSAIAGSPYYQCYLNSQEYLASSGSQELPTVAGAGKGQNPGDNPTATSAFVATYLDTEIGHQLVQQLAAKRSVTLTEAQLADARTSLSNQISSVMAEVAQTAQGENPKFSCNHTFQPLTGEQVLAQLPASFVDGQVHFVATAAALQEDLAGIGSSEADLVRYYDNHQSQFDTVCFNGAEYSSESAAAAAASSVASGTSFAQVAANAAQKGTIPCGVLTDVAAELGVSPASLEHLTASTVSDPINLNGTYLLVQLASRTPTSFDKAKAAVETAVQNAGSQVAQTAITAAERHASGARRPAVRHLGPGQRLGVHAVHARGVGRVEPHGQRGRRLHVGVVERAQRLTVAPLRPHITVVGLGPAGPDMVGEAVEALLASPGRTYVRTARHPAAARAAEAQSFDGLYESAATFDEVYAAIVEALVAAAERAAPEPVVYAVPGSPLVAERTVELLRGDDRVDLTVVPAPSFLDLAWAALGIDPVSEGVRLVDAADFGDVSVRERGPFLVAQCWSRHQLSEVKLAAPDEVEMPRAVLLHHLGLEDEVVHAVDWWELDRTLEPDHLTSLYVPALPERPGPEAAGVEVARLVTLMDTLREQCPWDRVQTHSSLMPHLVEECYEVLDALAAVAAGAAGPAGADASAPTHLEEELGDLLFQIVFHARLAAEEGQFDLAGVARTVHDKLVHRHPHVFADADAASASEVLSNWEAIKKEEKGRASVTEGIPTGLPALMLTSKLARKARSVGLAPDDPVGLREAAARLDELSERAQEEPHADDPLDSRARDAQRAVGGLLFAVATVAQRVGVDPEQALRERALSLRADILATEGVPDPEMGTQ